MRLATKPSNPVKSGRRARSLPSKIKIPSHTDEFKNKKQEVVALAKGRAKRRAEQRAANVKLGEQIMRWNVMMAVRTSPDKHPSSVALIASVVDAYRDLKKDNPKRLLMMESVKCGSLLAKSLVVCDIPAGEESNSLERRLEIKNFIARALRAMPKEKVGIHSVAIYKLGESGARQVVLRIGMTDWDMASSIGFNQVHSHDKTPEWYLPEEDYEEPLYSEEG